MRQIDLSGPEGNAFSLMGTARRWGNQLGLDTDAILDDMKSGDYEHLLDVFREHFSSVCELVYDNEDDDEDWDD